MSPTVTIGARLFGLTDRGRSVILPCFKNFGDQCPNGPNTSHGLPLITRLSRCVPAMGGAPADGRLYTLAWCAAVRARRSARRNAPPTGKPPKPLASRIPDFCSSGTAPPPAPMNTNFAFTFRFSSVRRLTIVTVQLPSDSLRRSRTS